MEPELKRDHYWNTQLTQTQTAEACRDAQLQQKTKCTHTHTSKHTHVGKHIPANVNPTVILVCAMQTHTRTRTFCETSRSHDVCVTLKVPECAWEAGRTCCHTTGVTQYCCKHFSVIIGHMCSQEGTLHFGLPHHSLYACIAA